MEKVFDKVKKISLVLVCVLILTSNICHATNVGNWYYPNYGYYPYGYLSNAYAPSNNYVPNYNFYYNPYYQGNVYNIPENSHYYIVGYDRSTTQYYNGIPMISRVPIIAGTDYFSARIANGIIYNAYGSISKWCNDYVLTKEGIQDYYLNYARIVSETASNIVLNVNCSFKRVGIINGYMEFRINVDIYNNRYTWKRLNADGTEYNEDYHSSSDEYEYEYDDGRIIIIR